VTDWNHHGHHPGPKLLDDTTNKGGGDFYLATTGDLNLATSGDFSMATDRRRIF
jgi:hypothetical protein